MNTPRKICPICKTENEATVFECHNCGAFLNDFPTDVVSIPDMANAPVAESESFIDTSLIPEGGIGIHIPGAPKPYYLHIYKELIVGRPTDATLEAVLDLSEVAAYAMGVSRRHVKIRRTATGFEVIDLGSRNGTWLNSERLIPQKAYPFVSGSQLRLGKIRLLLVYNTPSEKRRS
ncbi:MAG TPA: FHA domain-containing protein [Anaerolineales bacterium]|nr:FHA domain-containing protein [Anaerolineales bacterium]